jgi:hypothetical protein
MKEVKSIWLVLKPWDYTIADFEVFDTYKEATEHFNEARRNKEKNSENWSIQEIAII